MKALAAYIAAISILGLIGDFANAADQGITGKKLLLKSTGKLVLISKDSAISIAGSDPVGGSGSSITFDDGSGPVSFDLPASNWSTNGSGTLFKYKNPSAPSGPSAVKIAKVKPGLLKVVAEDLPFAVPNGPATIDVVLSLDGGTNRYCMSFGGTGDGSKFLVKDTTAGACEPPPITNTCSFDGAVDNSGMQICLLGVCPPGFDITGAIDISCDPDQDVNGKRDCQCGLQTFEPFPISGVGVACVDPGGSCPVGAVDCDGGDELGVDMIADANVGGCTSNADCGSTCAAHCSGMGSQVYDAACENFCQGGVRNDLPCICDRAGQPGCSGGVAGVNDCPGGSCEGQDNEADTDCHCICIDDETPLPGVGALACGLGMLFRIEESLPCDNADVLVESPPQCVPFTSTDASGSVLDLNENPGSMGFGESGMSGTCAHFDLGSTSAYELVSVLPVFDSTIGDLIFRITADCSAPPVCGNNLREGTEVCDGADAPACAGICQPDCTCPPLGQQTCTLNPATSQILLDAGFTTLPVQAAGAIDLDCGSVDATGSAPCDCSLQSFQPYPLGALGFVCVTPSSSTCTTGQIDCDGGDVLDVGVGMNHSIGTCTSHADCEAQCASFCGVGTPLVPQCEGFCLGGSNDGAVCTSDAGCPDGQCPGPNGGHVTAHHCQCGCVGTGPNTNSAPGGLKCELGVRMTIETALPCDDADVLVYLGDACIPITSETATGVLNNANLGGGTLPTSGLVTLNGSSVDCGSLQSGATAGLGMRGTIGFFDTSLADLFGLITLDCQ